MTSAGCSEVFEDVVGDKITGLDGCLEALVPGNTPVVVAHARMGRSTAHVILTVEELGRRDVGFKSPYKPMFDTTSRTGAFLLTVFAGLAQLERRMLSQRTKSALAAKRGRGETLGRPLVLTRSQIIEAKAMIDDGKGASYLARRFKVNRAKLYRALKKLRRQS